MVRVSFIGRKKIPFSFLMEDFNAYRLCTFWSLVEVEKNHVLKSEMSILCGWIRFGSMFVRRLAAIHIQGLGGIRVFRSPSWSFRLDEKNKKEEESKQWKLIRNICLTTVALFTFRNCNKDLWGQKLTPFYLLSW